MKNYKAIITLGCITLILSFILYRLSKPAVDITFLKHKSSDTVFHFEITNKNPFPIQIPTYWNQKELAGYLLLKDDNTHHFSKSCGTFSPKSKKLSPFQTEEFYINTYEPEVFTKIGIKPHSPSSLLQLIHEKYFVKNKEQLPKVFSISAKLEL